MQPLGPPTNSDPPLVTSAPSASTFSLGFSAADPDLAVGVRMISVLRYGPSLRDHHPFFNFRVTQHLAEQGLKETMGWFDEDTWYPLGRSIGGTIYPGLMVVANAVHQILGLVMPVQLETVCIYLPVALSLLTPLCVYCLGKQLKDAPTGLVAAGLVAIVPAYTARTGAGAFDNDCIGIPLMLLTFLAWLAAVETGGLLRAALTALAYFCTVACGGEYIFVVNLLASHTLVLMVTGRFTTKVYVAYTVFYPVAVLLAMLIPLLGDMALLCADQALPMVRQSSSVFFFFCC